MIKKQIYVILGGATVWPYAGISVFPEKGSGILWYNRLRNNDLDFYMKHTACTVLLGNKWIGNKWIGYNAQWSGPNCALFPYAKYEQLHPYDFRQR